MENFFTEKMAVKSDSELLHIIENKDDYPEEAYLAAAAELEKRKLASEESLAEEQQVVESETGREKGGRKKALRETIELLKPSKDYLFTPLIAYLNILIFIVMVLSGVHPIEPSVEALIEWGGNLRQITLAGQQWRLLTSVFLHGGLFHLLLNLYALLHIGGLLESKFGKNRYLFTYIATGLFSSIASLAFNDNIVSIGASGAIFGMYGLFLSLLILKVLDIPKETRSSLIPSILFFIGFNLFYGFAEEGIDNAAHIGGLISGFIIGFAYFPSFKHPESEYSKYVSVGLSVILLVIIFISPKVFTSKADAFQTAIMEFSKIEEKALWMYYEDISEIPEDQSEHYYDRLKSEGIDLWEDNLKLLSTLTDLPPYLQERVDLLTEYCDLRIQSCEAMRHLIKYNTPSDQEKIDIANKKIERIINDLQKLNE